MNTTTEHPFEIACKLARSLYDRRERDRLRAAIHAETILAGGRRATVALAAPQLFNPSKRGTSNNERAYASLNGHPMSIAGVATNSGLTHKEATYALNDLKRRGMALATGRGVFQRA